MIEENTGINLTGKDLNERLLKIAKEEYDLEFDYMSFMVAPDKETDDEKVIEDARSLFHAIKTGEKMTPLFSVGIDKNGNRYSTSSPEWEKKKEVSEEERESVKKIMDLLKE